MVSDINEILVSLANFRITGKHLACEHRRISGCQFIFGGTSDSRRYVCVRSLANVQVRRSFGNGGSLRDPAAKEASAKKDS